MRCLFGLSGVRAESLTQSTPHLWVSGQVSGPSHSHRVRPTCGYPVRCQGQVTHTGRAAHGVHPTCGCQWPVRCQGRVTHTEYAPPVDVSGPSGVRAESLTQSTPHLWVSGQVSGPSHSHRVRPTCGCPVRCQGRVTHTGRAAHGARGTTPTQGTDTEYAPPVGVRSGVRAESLTQGDQLTGYTPPVGVSGPSGVRAESLTQGEQLTAPGVQRPLRARADGWGRTGER